MILDIFSSFDPASFSSLYPSTSILLISNIVIIILIQLSFWSMPSRLNMISFILSIIIFNQLSRTYSNNLKGSSSIISTLFPLIILINLIGLNPYTFSLSSHLIITLCLGLPMWISFIFSSFTKNLKASIAHLLPDGAPDWLNPFLIIIETTRVTNKV